MAKRLGLDGATTHTLRLVIEQHLIMASISQRRDLDDPAVIRNFAGLIQTPENLRLLTLHTFADSLGTSDKLWNGFKDSLLLAALPQGHGSDSRAAPTSSAPRKSSANCWRRKSAG